MLKKTYLVLICVLLLTGCSTSEVEKPWATADPLLMTFMPSTLVGYWGDGDYYHESNRIETSVDENGSWTHVFGEVKDNSKGYTNIDFKYQFNYLVDAHKIVQTHQGEALNDSIFSSIELLKLPVEVGNTWQFTSEDPMGKAIKVTAEILEVSDAGDHVVVKHSTKDGYYEKRELNKGLGVTDFIRQVIYKDESTYTGYHIEKENVVSDVTVEFEMEGIEISEAHYAVIEAFQNAWALYIKDVNTSIFDTVLSESNAEQKIKSLIKMPTYDLEFLQFMPYDQLIVGNANIIYVREQYKNYAGDVIESKTMFTIIEAENQLYIIDFESIK